MKRWFSALFFCLFVFYAFSQTDTLEKSMSFDFGFTRGKNIELWPIVRKYKDGDTKETQILFSIYSQTIDYKNHRNHTHFYPFFVSDSAKNNLETRILSTYYPSFIHFKQDSLSKSFRLLELAPNISCLGIASSQNGLFVDNNLFFFLWYKNDLLNQRRKFIFFPVYWYWATKTERNHLIFPIYKNKKLYSETDTLTTNTIFPIFWQSKNKTSSSKVVFPIYWSKQDSVKNNTVLFPLIWKLQDTTYKSLIAFPFYSTGHSLDSMALYRHKNILGLYTRIHKPMERQSILLPFYVSKTSFQENDTIYSKTFFPIYWSTKDKNETNTTLFPVYWNQKDSVSKSRIFFPFVWNFEDPEKKSVTFFPFYSFGQSKESFFPYKYTNFFGVYTRITKPRVTRNILLPIFFTAKRFRDNDTIVTKTIFPIYWYTKNQQLTAHTFFPLFYSTKDSLRNTKVLFPILWKYDNSRYKSFTFFPVFSVGHSKDSLRSVSHYNIGGLFTHTRNKNVTKDYLFPLYWSRTTKYYAATLYRKVFFPVFWSYKDNTINNKVFFPFWWSYRNEKYKSLTVFPLFSYSHSKDSTESYKRLNIVGIWNRHTSDKYVKNVLFPVYWSTTLFTDTDTIYRKRFFPIYGLYKDKDRTRAVFFPVVWKFNSPRFKSSTFFPLVSWGHTNDSLQRIRYFNLAGVYTHVTKPELKRDIVFPIYWSKTSCDSAYPEKNKTLFPIYWSRKNNYSNRKVLFPIVWHSTYFNRKNVLRNITIFPIYWSSKDSSRNDKVIFPFVWKYDNEDTKSFTLFPIFSHGKSKDSINPTSYFNIVGLYTQIQKPEEKQSILFPFYWAKRNTEESYSVFFPFYWKFNSKKSNSTTLFPFFHIKNSSDSLNSSKKTNILGFYNTNVSKDSSKTSLFPIFWSKKDSISNNKTLFPLIWKRDNQKYTSFTFFPLISIGHSKDSAKMVRHTFVTPIAGVLKKGSGSTTYLFPIFKHKRSLEKSETSVLWPLCYHSKSAKERKFRIAPIVWSSKTDTSKLFSIQPLHYTYKSETERTFVLSWFLYRYQNKFNQSVRHDFLWKLYNQKRDTNGDFETRFLHFMYVNVKKEGTIEKGIFPIYHKKSKINGDKSTSALFGFYNHFKQFKPDIEEFYEEERIFWFLRLRSNYNLLKQKGKANNLKRR